MEYQPVPTGPAFWQIHDYHEHSYVLEAFVPPKLVRAKPGFPAQPGSLPTSGENFVPLNQHASPLRTEAVSNFSWKHGFPNLVTALHVPQSRRYLSGKPALTISLNMPHCVLSARCSFPDPSAWSMHNASCADSPQH